MNKTDKDSLAEVYKSSKLLMQAAMLEHQPCYDFLCGLRFHLSIDPAGIPMVQALNRVIEHHERLRVVASSYHKTVGDVVRWKEGIA